MTDARSDRALLRRARDARRRAAAAEGARARRASTSSTGGGRAAGSSRRQGDDRRRAQAAAMPTASSASTRPCSTRSSRDGSTPSRRSFAGTSPSTVTGASSCACSASSRAPPRQTKGRGVNDGLVKILDGNTFVVSDSRGDIEASLTDPTGLFSFDTRFLSRWVLTVNGERLNPLSVDDLQYFETRFFLVPGTGTVYIDAKLSVIRQRAVSTGFHEELTILNHADKPVSLSVRIDAGCDFADLFEVKDALAKKGRYSSKVERRKLTLGYERGPFVRATAITASAPARFDADGLTFTVRIPAHGEWTTGIDVVTARTRRGPGAARAAGSEARPGADASEPRALDRRGAARRVRLGAAQGDVPTEPRRPRRAALLAADRGWPRAAGGRAAVVHDDVRPRQHLHEPAGAAVHARARRDDAAGARRLAGRAARRLPRRGSRPDPPRDALRGDDGVRGATALAVLRLGRRDAALHRAPRRVRALDRRSRARPRARDRGARGAQLDRRVRGSPGHGLHLVPAPQRGVGPREPVLEGLVGLDLVPRRLAARASRGRRASSRGTRTTRRCAARGSRARSGRTRRSPTSSSAMPPISSGGSTATTGSRTASTSRSRSIRTGDRSTRSRRTTATCSGAASSTSRRRRRSRGICSGRGSSPAGACARSRWERGATTRSGTTPAPSGRSTTRSSRGVFAATASRTRRRRSRRASSTRPSSSTAACRRRSAGTRASRRSTRCSTRPRAARRRGRPERRSCSCGRCSGSSRTASTSSSIPRSRARSATSSCSTSPAAGAGSTLSVAVASTSGVARSRR